MVQNSTATSSNIKLDKAWQVDVIPKEPSYFDRFLPATHQQTTLFECGIDMGDEYALPHPKIHVLAIRQPWASLVIHGLKNIDIRSKNTSVRGTIAIYASRAPIRKKDLKWVNENCDVPDDLFEDLPTGMIIGTANLIECMEYESDFHFKLDQRRHLNREENYCKNIKGWLLRSPRPIEPVDYKFNGEVVWSLADTEILQQTA
ncbi:MAG: ASCH domain-containing protein [Methanosarcinales archaeon]|nr:ASCH domain-containing protein [Methanosarcinales archaeon]